MNSVILIGRIARDPELRTTQNQMQVCRFSVAVNRRQRQQEGQPTADFISCVAFAKTATNISIYFRKGSRIGVEGHIQTGSYTDKDGKKVYTTDVIVDQFDFIDTKSESQQLAGDAEPQRQQPQEVSAPDGGFMHIPDGINENLPFD